MQMSFAEEQAMIVTELWSLLQDRVIRQVAQLWH